MKKAIYNNGKLTYIELSEEEIEELQKRRKLEKKQKELKEKQNEILELKEQLNATDYKIIKASEYNLLGLECEYDIQVLHTERQALRDRINELESEVQENDT